jgi:hypothetical protein
MAASKTKSPAVKQQKASLAQARRALRVVRLHLARAATFGTTSTARVRGLLNILSRADNTFGALAAAKPKPKPKAKPKRKAPTKPKAKPKAKATRKATPKPKAPPMTVESQILNAARELGATRSKDVRIRDIRDALPKVSPKQFDQAMQVLHDSKKIAIYRDDTSSAVSSVGAYLVNGKLRHLLYLL